MESELQLTMSLINWARLCLPVTQSPISVRGRENEGHIHPSQLNTVRQRLFHAMGTDTYPKIIL